MEFSIRGEINSIIPGGATDLVVIDWNDDREKLLKSGISVEQIFSQEEWNLDLQDHCLIRNFPDLRVKNAHLTDCIFVDCGRIILEEGTAVRCVFQNVANVVLDNTKVYDSDFRDLQCDNGDFIISMEDSTISGCSFQNVHLENETYLVDGVGDCLVEKCSFENVSTDREDRSIVTCKYFKGKLIRREYTYDITSECTGLDQVKKAASKPMIQRAVFQLHP